MPFAGYTNFDDCVSRNRDKDDPDAYCGSIKHKVEDKALDAVRAGITEINKLFGKKPTVPKGPVQNPQPQGIPAKVYQGKGFSGVAPAQPRRQLAAPHPGLARGPGRVGKQHFVPSPADPKRGELPKKPSAEERYAGRAPGDTSKPPSGWAGSRFNPRNKPMKKHETEENPEHSHDPTKEGGGAEGKKKDDLKTYRVHFGYVEYTVKGPEQQTSTKNVKAKNEKDARKQILDYYKKNRPYVARVAEWHDTRTLRALEKHELSADAPKWGWHPRGPQAKQKPVKKNGGGTDEATPELADVTMIGRTLQSVAEILSEHAQEHHDLDKKKSRRSTKIKGVKPSRKPHGQTKPRQQRGTAHGQRLAKHETEENPSHSHDPRKSESEAEADRRLHTAIFDPKPERGGRAEYEPITKFGRTAREHRHHGVAHDHKGGTFVHSHEEKAEGVKRPILGPGPQSVSGPRSSYPLKKHETGALHDDCETILSRVEKHVSDLNPEHSHSPYGSAQSYAARRAETHDRARTAQRLQSQRDKIHGDIERRRDAREKRRRHLDKQHPDEYPQEWGPKHLYQKIAEEVEKIDKRLSLEPLKPKPPSASHRHVGKPRPDVPPAVSRTHEVPPYGTRAHETYQQAHKAIDEIKKAVGGCPAGWHKHEPYDYCHPMKRAHRGETMMKPAGALEDAHGVLDEAVVQARALGVGGLERVLANFKEGLKDTRDPADAYKRLAGAAARIEQHAKDRIMAGKDDSPQERMQTKVVVDILRRAASKVKPKPEAGDQAHADVPRMDDKKLSRHYDALVNYLKGDRARQLAPDVHQEYIDRLKAVNAELGRRAQAQRAWRTPGMGTERQNRPGGGRANA